MSQADAITLALRKLQRVQHEMSTLEVSHLASWTQYGVETPHQRLALARLVGRYLPNHDDLAAEILGQERLL